MKNANLLKIKKGLYWFGMTSIISCSYIIWCNDYIYYNLKRKNLENFLPTYIFVPNAKKQLIQNAIVDDRNDIINQYHDYIRERVKESTIDKSNLELNTNSSKNNFETKSYDGDNSYLNSIFAAKLK